MLLAPFYFKQRAKRALKGNWQTALLVTFFSGVLLTALSVMQTMCFPDVLTYLSYGMVNELAAEMQKVPMGTWVGYYALALVAFVVTPTLTLGANNYFLCRLHKQELGFTGLFSRIGSFGRALWLYVQMFARIFAWSLLLFVPGILAAMRYSMAPYFLAEDPTLTASQAIEKSKNCMKGNMMSYFSLVVSFIGWLLLASLFQMLILDLSFVLAMVLTQFVELFINTYMNATIAAFFLTVAAEDGVERALKDMKARLEDMGYDVSGMSTTPREPGATIPDDEELEPDDERLDPHPEADADDPDEPDEPDDGAQDGLPPDQRD